VAILAYAARDAELRELLEVLVPPDAATRTTSRDEVRSAIVCADAYHHSHRAQFSWKRGEHDPDASLIVMMAGPWIRPVDPARGSDPRSY
jgi:hypothetical protein